MCINEEIQPSLIYLYSKSQITSQDSADMTVRSMSWQSAPISIAKPVEAALGVMDAMFTFGIEFDSPLQVVRLSQFVSYSVMRLLCAVILRQSSRFALIMRKRMGEVVV